MADLCDSLRISGRFRRLKPRNGKAYRIVHNDLTLTFHNVEKEVYADKSPFTPEKDLQDETPQKDSERQSEQRLRTQLPLDSPSNSPVSCRNHVLVCHDLS